MSNWIKILYSNTALVEHKNLKWRWSILLYVLIIFIVSAPFSVSLFSTRLSDILKDPVAFESDFAKLVKNVDCTIDDTASLVCVKDGASLSSTVLEYPNYTILIYPSSSVTPGKNTIVFNKTQMEVTDAKGTVIVSGTYDYLIGFSFKDIKTGLANKSIDPALMADNVLRAIVLSSFGTLALTRLLVMLANTTMFVLVIAFFFRYISVKRPTIITYKQSVAIVVQTMAGPALLAAFVGMFLPEQSLLLFLLLFVVRFMSLYQAVIHKKISLN